MAKSMDTGVLPVEPETAATLLAGVFNTQAVQVTSPFETLKLTAYTVTVHGLDYGRLVFRVRSEGGLARILVQMYRR